MTLLPDSQQPENAMIQAVSLQDIMVQLWLDTKTKRSAKTREAYTQVMTYFRQHLAARSLNLFDDIRAVSLVASEYATTSYDRRGRVKGGTLSEGTINQRLAILSSFYLFCHKQEKRVENPIDLCEREKYHVHDDASHLASEEVTAILKGIDRTAIQGQRDYTLLLLALTTGRRAAELIDLEWRDLRTTGKQLEVTWRHCKGNKTMKDILGANTREALLSYAQALYGEEEIAAESPLFVSFSHNNTRNKMSSQAVANVCKKYLGTAKIHTTRHTFAVNSEQAGSSLSEIGERLGHSSLKTTSDYMKRRHSAENRTIQKLESLYGL